MKVKVKYCNPITGEEHLGQRGSDETFGTSEIPPVERVRGVTRSMAGVGDKVARGGP